MYYVEITAEPWTSSDLIDIYGGAPWTLSIMQGQWHNVLYCDFQHK